MSNVIQYKGYFTNVEYSQEDQILFGKIESMRLDKYLKVSRIIKRRTVAKDACDKGIVTINGKVAKSSSEVKIGDVLEITFGEKKMKFKISEIKEHVLKADAKEMYEIVE